MGNNNEESFADKGKRIVKNNIIPGFKAGLKQKSLGLAGGVAGTALAMKKGKSLRKAIGGAGLMGMAAGDTLGSIAVPQHDLYKRHKKEFGTAPDAKSVGKVFAVNTLPTAASWGAILGSKKGKKLFTDGYAAPIETVKAGVKETKKGFDAIRTSARAGKIEKKDVGPAVRGAMKAGKQKMKETMGTSGKAALKMFIADKAMDKVVEAPTYAITPKSIIEKKKRERGDNMNNLENLKQAIEIIDYEFNKIARTLSDSEKKKVYKENKNDFKKLYSDAGLDLKGALKYRPSAKEIKDTQSDARHMLKSKLKGAATGAAGGGLLGATLVYKQLAGMKHPWGREATRQLALKNAKNFAVVGGLTGDAINSAYNTTSRQKDRKAQRFEKALDNKFGRQNTVRVEQGGKKAFRNAYAQSLANYNRNKSEVE